MLTDVYVVVISVDECSSEDVWVTFGASLSNLLMMTLRRLTAERLQLLADCCLAKKMCIDDVFRIIWRFKFK